MTTKIKVGYDEQSKLITAKVDVESDTLSPEDVLALSTKLMIQALTEAQTLTMKYKTDSIYK